MGNPGGAILDTHQGSHFADLIISWVKILVIALFLEGCSIPYVLRAGWTEAGILIRRVPIETAIEDTTLSKEQRASLHWVAAAHAYALRRKLDCAGSFKSYSPLEKEALSWVLAGAKPFELTPKQWWFPIVGYVPYQGFFEKSDAIYGAEKLKKDGYQTIVRPVTAFSTLGWFNDPALTPLLKRPPIEIVNTIIHECVHSTMWVPDNVPFNESVAHFVALNETIRFFNTNSCPEVITSADTCYGYSPEAKTINEREILYAQALNDLRNQLVLIFNNRSLSQEQMSEEKRSAYEKALSPIVGKNNRIEDNNAALLQELAYHQYFDCFLNERAVNPDSDLPELLNHLKECQAETTVIALNNRVT